MSRVLNYNEHKVRQKEAEILQAQNFLKDTRDLSFSDKTRWFERFTSLNERTKTNTLHVSLNFDPTEKLANEKMIEIANEYMKKIGFGEQPYLVYRHYDAGHPHLHILSTNIRSDGSRISMHNMGRSQSEKARKEIEIDFGLIKAQGKKSDNSFKLIPVSAQKVALGKSSVKRAISNVLGLVIDQYKYSSLPELNAVLQLYNVLADRGEKGSVMHEVGGLVYRVLDDKGNKISPPVKASSFYMKPILKNLQLKFIENEKSKQIYAKRLKTSIDYALLNKTYKGIQPFISTLNKERISVVLRQNKDGIIYGITYVDHHTKSVFNGSDLGKPYSAKMILERTRSTETKPDNLAAYEKKIKQQQPESSFQESPFSGPIEKKSTALEMLPTPDKTFDFVPYQLKKKKKRKKRKNLKL